MTTNAVRNPTAIRISATRSTFPAPSLLRGGVASATPGGALSLMPPAPPFEAVDEQQHQERHRQQHHADRRRLGVLELVELLHDLERRDLRLAALVARDEDDRTVLADR